MFDRKQFLESLSHNNKPTSVDAEGRIWVWHEQSRMYEQMNTGVMLNEQQYNARNIEIIGYYDGGSDKTTTEVVVVDFLTNADGQFRNTSGGQINTAQAFTTVKGSSAYSVNGTLDVKLDSSTIIVLTDDSGVFSDVPFISFYAEGPSPQKGWYIATGTGTLGKYTYLRSQQRTDFPPLVTNFDQPLAVIFYSADPGDPSGWSDYTV